MVYPPSKIHGALLPARLSLRRYYLPTWLCSPLWSGQSCHNGSSPVSSTFSESDPSFQICELFCCLFELGLDWLAQCLYCPSSLAAVSMATWYGCLCKLANERMYPSYHPTPWAPESSSAPITWLSSLRCRGNWFHLVCTKDYSSQGQILVSDGTSSSGPKRVSWA